MTRARVHKNTFFKGVSHDYHLTQGDRGDRAVFLHDLPNVVTNYMQRYPISQNTNETELSVQKWFNKLMTQFETKWVGFTAKDTHDRGYLCGLMPDISIFKKEDVADGSFIPMLVQTIL